MVKPEGSKFYEALQEFYNRLSDFRDMVYGGGISRDKLEPTRVALVRSMPKFKQRVSELTGKRNVKVHNMTADIWDIALSERVYDSSGLTNRQCLNMLVDVLTEALGTLEAKTEDKYSGGDRIDQEVSSLEMTIFELPKTFVAHGGESESLTRLLDFLRALGVEPIVAEIEPSQGSLTESQVNSCIEEADCAIVFATYGHVEDVKTGTKHPRLNVIDELGRCRVKYPQRTILLLEDEVELPSNVSGIIYERFTKQSMDKAFIKVAKELKAFGIIKALKPPKKKAGDSINHR